MHEDELTERILSVSARNIPTEYELTYRVKFSVASDGKTLIEDEEVSATRDISFDEAQLLAKEREQEILREGAGARPGRAGHAPHRGAVTAAMNARPAIDVLRVGPGVHSSIESLTPRYGAELVFRGADATLPGSYWGESEAGLRGNLLYVRADTPLHSLLHELSHFVCMTPERRAGLDRDAGGDDAEECAVCYLQIVLADELPMLGRERMLARHGCLGIHASAWVRRAPGSNATRPMPAPGWYAQSSWTLPGR